MTTADQLRDLLDVIASAAPKLRSAGVRKLEAGGVAFDLDPPDLDLSDLTPATSTDKTSERLGEEAEALDDAVTFGLPPGTKLPGFTRPPDLERKADT